jgi:hypothetical protein
VKTALHTKIVDMNHNGMMKEKIKFKDMMQVFKYVRFIDEEMECMKKLLCSQTNDDTILIDDLISIFKKLGIKESLPKKKHLNFQKLENKSIRILNRFFEFLDANDLPISKIYKEHCIHMKIKTKNGLRSDELLATNKFFEILFLTKVKNSIMPCANLVEFLCVSKECHEYLMLRKIERAQKEFRKNDYLKRIGFAKRIEGEIKPEFKIMKLEELNLNQKRAIFERKVTVLEAK